ncbi:MAG: IS200/IS605 family transposase [Verrucomicrobia bacterium]|nr:IS200/IS605 family transposase [Verrucomicrobiota bacterium]
MASTFTQIYYHLVFSTKDRERVLVAEQREELLRYVWGIIRNQHGHLYRINAVEDHVHLLTSLHPSVALANLVKDIKVASSGWIKEKGLFPGFHNWQEGYSAFTASHADKDRLIEYIKNQPEHHHQKTFREELRDLLVEARIEFDERYLD